MTQTTKVVLGVVLAAVLIALGVGAFNKMETSPVTNNGDTYTIPNDTPNISPSTTTSASKKQKCESRGGTWSSMYNECTGVSSNSCSAIGGKYDDCESPCRHDPKAEVCIEMCVAVCEL